jgi:uncharacterized membrane protein YdjX (TVP38/TMEM64 family)
VKFSSHKILVAAIAGAVALAGAGSYLYFSGQLDVSGWIGFILNEESHPMLFIGLMLVLPMAGFPISVFLVLAGLKFGAFLGAALTAVLIPVHLAVAYWVAGSWLRSHLEAYLDKKNRRLPRVPENRLMAFTFVFMAVPSLPYAMKNYILPLSGVPLRCHLTAGWAGQLAICIPFVGLGGSVAEANYKMTLVIVAVIAAGYLVFKWLRK